MDGWMDGRTDGRTDRRTDINYHTVIAEDMCSIFLPLFFLSQLITGTEIEFRGHVRFSLAFRSDALAVNTNGSSEESYGARRRIRASFKV